ncbi:hypothetical protein CLOL250_02421 [Clostridium sp. L2-50]|nr:hypothetical protein CLOL250_02421 [Clostridium sp. L2-50]
MNSIVKVTIIATAPSIANAVIVVTQPMYVRISCLTNAIKLTNHHMFVITVRITNPVLWTRKYMMLLMPKGNTRKIFIIPVKALT